MSDESKPPAVLRRWWLGVFVGFVLPLSLVPATVFVQSRTGMQSFLTDTLVPVALVSSIAGIFVVFRPIWICLVAAAFYLPLFWVLLVLLRFAMGCRYLYRACL